MQHLLEHRKQLVQLGRNRRVGAFVSQAHAQVFFHGEARKNLAALRHKAHAGAGAFVRRGVVNRLAVKLDAAGLDGHQAHERLEQRGLAHAVAAQQNGDLAHLRLQADVTQNVRAAVVLVDVVDVQHGV